MVTKIIDLNKETVTTEFKVTEDCIFVKDNKFTESGIIEIGFISGIKRANIFLLPRTGDTLTTKAKLLSNYSSGNFSICTMECKIYTAKELVADCILNFLIQEV